MTCVLILGGTSEAVALAGALEGWPDLRVISSLAGRTRKPGSLPGESRSGGFGGVDGLVRYLREETVDALIDATHPFAERMTANAALAAERAGVPRLRLLRPPWERQERDNWIEVAGAAAAAAALPGLAHRVFLTSGHRDLDVFAKLDTIWFLIRTIEPVAVPLPRQCLCVTGRGPFDEHEEYALLQKHRIDTLVTKASGGPSTYAKIAASRRLHLPVIMISRPPPPPGPLVHHTDAAQSWLRQVTA